MTTEDSTNQDTGEAPEARHFIQQLIDEHIAAGRWGEAGDRSVVRTRFPPEPNGFLHVGHAKSICLNFGLAEEFGGSCNLRFDDTNPEKEEDRYVQSIVEDVRWLGFGWPGASDADPQAGVRFASDYFPKMEAWARLLIEAGGAYVDEQSADEMRAQRGTLTDPGTPSPHRQRPAAESMALFDKMKAGEVETGSMVLRAKIDMASSNMNLRDPVMYRVVNTPHHRTGSEWSIYPMYDWAHGLEDSIEGITNSICTLEFENHRPLYDWFIEAINRALDSKGEPRIHHPQQTEFARFNPTFIITSKRKLLQLVEQGRVEGWDDPRMPTISGMRRRGYTPESIRAACDALPATKFNASHDIGLIENALRQDLNGRAPRRMAVLRPLKVVITNWGEHGDETRVEMMSAVNNPESEAAGTREVPFGRELYIERDDFMEDAPRKFFRLKPGGEVRLRYGYWITCTEVIKDGGEIVELRCTYDPQTRGGDAPPPDAEGKVRKVKGTIHWVHADSAEQIDARLFDRLFTAERPGKATGEFLDDLNPDSLEPLDGALIESNWRTSETERSGGTGGFADGIERFQFERLGYFAVDPEASETSGRVVFNRAVTLKDSWSKAAKKQ